MRSYTSKDGVKVEVSQEHLETAVRLKRELQMVGSGHRCNWKQLTRMMSEEGFDDAEASETYRLMIKNYQASIGQLDSVEKYADLVADGKLASIKEAVGEMAYHKREVQLESQRLGKLKRDLTLYGVIAEQVYEALINELDTYVPQWAYSPRIETKNRMVVFLSDLHIGAVVVNVNGNSYNFDIAKKRMKKYLDKIVDLAVANNVTTIDVVSLGDITEHVNMRKTSQAFETEFHMSEQIVKAYELIRDFLINLTMYFNVTYRGIAGNHDRMAGNKEENIDGDSSTFVVNYMIKTFIESADINRMTYCESDRINHSSILSINGVVIKCVHGDFESRNGSKISAHMAQDGAVYNILAMGHLHHYNVTEVGLNQFEAYFGSLKGQDTYAMRGKFGSGSSQGVIIIDEAGEFDIRRIDVQKV